MRQRVASRKRNYGGTMSAYGWKYVPVRHGHTHLPGVLTVPSHFGKSTDMSVVGKCGRNSHKSLLWSGRLDR